MWPEAFSKVIFLVCMKPPIPFPFPFPFPTDHNANCATFTEEVSHFSGGGELVSTAADYLRFSQMLLNGGELDGVRILGPKTIELMTQNHLGDIAMWDGAGPYGFGLGFAIGLDRGISGRMYSEGTYGWGGMAHTGFWVDPQEELIGIFLIQILPESPLPYRDLYIPLVYQAIID